MPKTLLLILLLTSLQSFGQGDFLLGEIVDSTNLEPIAFATVAFKGKAVGVISNLDGGFGVPERFKSLGDTLRVSSMGYETKEILLAELSTQTATRIYLQPAIFELEEAVVEAKKKRLPSARKIVRRAIENIPKNYPIRTFSTVGYYRDYQLDSLEYLNLNEALLEVFDAGFHRTDMISSRVRLYEYVQNETFRRDSLADNPYNYKDWRKVMNSAYLPSYGGNEFEILRVHDAIRNYKLNTFDFINNMSKGDILRHHTFWKLEDTYSDEENLHGIRMTKTEPGYTVRGRIFISKSDYAIHKLQYAVYDDDRKNKDPLLQKQGIFGKLIFEVSTAYKRGQDEKMYLNYISFHNTFRLSEPPKFAVKHITFVPDKGAFAIRFNNGLAHVGTRFGDDIRRAVGEAKAYEKRWYSLRYKNKRIRFEKISIVNDSTVYLFPKMDASELQSMMNELATMQQKKIDIRRVLKFKVNGLADKEGNVLHKGAFKDYNQFREFFVQEVREKATFPTDFPFMDKDRPIFDNQPIKKPPNFEDYWMNTPLQKRN